MNSNLKIAQISDIHIGPTDAPFQNIDVRANFLRGLESIRQWKPDLLIISGDIAADEGELTAYLWVRSVMASYDQPYLYMAGNHDDVDVMHKVLHLSDYYQNGMFYYKHEICGKTLLLLDSSKDYLPEVQLKWMVENANDTQKEVVLFIHHPPALCGSLFMDSLYPLRNIEETHRYLEKCPNIQSIFTGHYHTEKEVNILGKNVYICPSTMMQISCEHKHFQIDHLRPGWRKIEWSDAGIRTEVQYY
jgi:3',5'-cyclic-AMP phosphodiesterase